MKAMHIDHLDLRINQRWLCKNLSMKFNPGEVWGILGPNGCGKTTLLHTLAGLIEPTAGEIQLAKQNLRALKRKSVAREIGILLQDNHFAFNQTVWEYCATARYPHLGYWQNQSARDQQIIRDALTQMDLQTFTQRNIMQLSGGEKRRLAIAALITQSPRVFLLDEPTNHLDIRHQMQVLNYFTQLAHEQPAIVIMSLHELNLAQQFCDNVLLMFGDGEIVQGTKSEMLTMAQVGRLYQHPLRLIQEGEKRYWLG